MNGGTATPDPYSVRAGAVAEDREAVLAVWRGNLGRASLLDAKYAWFYQHCPYGEPLLRLLQHADSAAPVGVAAAGPRHMLHAGEPVDAGLLVDLAVVPAHRTLLPAMRLQMALMADGLRRFDILYGFPNSRAEPVFKRIGYRQATQLVRYVRVLRTRRHLAARLPGPLATLAAALVDRALRLALRLRTAPRDACDWQAQPWTAIDAVWRDGPRPTGLMTVRDAQFARWRLAEAPETGMRFLVASDRRSGTPVAWLACGICDGVMVVHDFWSCEGVGRRIAALLDTLAAHARAAGCTSMSLEFQGDAAAVAAIRRAGFVARTTRPVYALASPRAAAWLDAASWHLTSADEDE